MPRHGPTTTPHMSNRYREEKFASGKCPYCNTESVTKEEKQVKLNPGILFDEVRYMCRCGAMGTFRKRV